MVIVTIEHVRAASLKRVGVLCAPGIRAWCARHGIDLRAFLAEGLPVERLEAIDDAFARRVCAIARGAEE